MDYLKDVRHITELQHSWASHKNQLRILFKWLLVYVTLLSVTIACASAKEQAACPLVASTKSIFSGEKVYKGSVIEIEKNDNEFPINLSLYRQTGNLCRKAIFAKYSKEGGDPNLDSVFFLRLNGRPNILTIVHWDVNSRGIGTYGKYYQVYAYVSDELGGLKENELVLNNDAMTGMDGYQEGRQVSFQFKNADAVRRFFKCKDDVCR